jgi:hypothetical protein
MAESKVEAARRSGSLTNVITAMREEQETQQSTATSGREEVDIVDGAIRLAAHLTEQGKTGAERRQALGEVKIGSTVTPTGTTKTTLSRAEKLAKTLAWAKSLSEDQRNEFMVSEKFEALTDRQQDAVAEAFGQIEERAYEDSIGIDNSVLDAPLIDIDSLPEDETEGVGDSFEVQEGEDVESFDDIFEQSAWEAEAT